MLGSEGELGEVLYGAIVVNDEAVVLPVAPGPRLALGDHQHWLHRENHSRGEHGVHILPQLQPWLPETKQTFVFCIWIKKV